MRNSYLFSLHGGPILNIGTKKVDIKNPSGFYKQQRSLNLKNLYNFKQLKKMTSFFPPGFTPLILAATAGHVGVVEVLLDKGGDIEAQSERTKDTPLSLACSGGRQEVSVTSSPPFTIKIMPLWHRKLSHPPVLVRWLSYCCSGEPIRNTAMFLTTLLSALLHLGVM